MDMLEIFAMLILGIPVLIMFGGMVLGTVGVLQWLYYGLLETWSGLRWELRKIPGTIVGRPPHKIEAPDTTKIPVLFRQFLNPHLVENKIRVEWNHIIACGCEYYGGNLVYLRRHLKRHLKRRQARELIGTLDGIIERSSGALSGRSYITINDCVRLLDSLIEHYELLDERRGISIFIDFTFNLKKIKDIDYMLRAFQVLNFVRGQPNEEDVEDTLLSDSSRRLGTGAISYPLVGPKSLVAEQLSMATFPREAKHYLQSGCNIFQVEYAGYECALKYLLAGVNGGNLS